MYYTSPEPQCVNQILHLKSAIHIARLKLFFGLWLHAWIDLRAQVDGVSNTVNNHTRVGLETVKARRRVYNVYCHVVKVPSNQNR